MVGGRNVSGMIFFRKKFCGQIPYRKAEWSSQDSSRGGLSDYPSHVRFFRIDPSVVTGRAFHLLVTILSVLQLKPPSITTQQF
jgi:hypothetical protein